jgi:hypothetical protein
MSADKDAADGAKEEIARIVAQIRERWPDVRIVLRADSGFARDDLMAWCEDNGVDYIFGLARNVWFVGAIKRELLLARQCEPPLWSGGTPVHGARRSRRAFAAGSATWNSR